MYVLIATREEFRLFMRRRFMKYFAASGLEKKTHKHSSTCVKDLL